LTAIVKRSEEKKRGESQRFLLVGMGEGTKAWIGREVESAVRVRMSFPVQWMDLVVHGWLLVCLEAEDSRHLDGGLIIIATILGKPQYT